MSIAPTLGHNQHLDASYADAVAAATMVGGTDPQLNPKESADTVARMSSKWEHDSSQQACAECTRPFTPLNRRHHCRLCGKIFCQACSSRRALIPPSAIVLTPKGGKNAAKGEHLVSKDGPTFEADDDPDRVLTYMKSPSTDEAAGGVTDTVLYGKGLEERYKLAREPLRVCDLCYDQLAGVQEELRVANSNAMRYNNVDPTDLRRLFNSPLAFTLGHEVRKAAYTLNNLLPLPRRMGAFVSSSDMYGSTAAQIDQCKDTCTEIGGNFSDLDGVRIPARLLEAAKGVAVLTVVKGGFGLAGFEFGTGLVVARLPDERGWSAPSAIGTAGVSWGALIGAQVSDHVFLLMNDAAVNLMASNDGSFQLGADIGVAVGPVGRSVEGNVGATGSSGNGGFAVAPIYTYSLSKGLYAGLSLDGKVLVTRHQVNEKFYGQRVRASDLLRGEVPTPPAAQPLYDALKRCHVYASPNDKTAAANTKSLIPPNTPQYAAFEDYAATEAAAVQSFSNLSMQQAMGTTPPNLHDTVDMAAGTAQMISPTSSNVMSADHAGGTSPYS